MQALSLAPYFHPTTVCVVDDNEAFLRSLSLDLPPTLAFRGFTDPREALEFLNTPVGLAPLADRCARLHMPAGGEAVMHIDFGAIEQEINHPERFRRVSVALVDYAMPAVNGLELCAQLRDPNLRKALLTGVADEKLAVEAFNAGLIHRFIAKQRAGAIEVLLAFIDELQAEYFRQYTARLQSALSLDPPKFLIDPDVATQVRELMARERLVEYYLVNDPPGFLLLRSDGSLVRLIILDRPALDHQWALARRYGAPPALLQQLERGELVGAFTGDSPADYFGEAFPWEEHLIAAERLNGARTWYLGLQRDPAPDIDFDPVRSSYDTFLRSR
ncbi:MAG: hypothetical protein R3E86_09950 [Pseudomonadales bacterium]